MANRTGIRTGLQALTQDHLSSVAINLIPDLMPLLYFLGLKDGNKNGFTGLGRPASGAIFTGLPMSSVKRTEVMNSTQYMPIHQTTLPLQSDGKAMGMYDTTPTRSNWTTATTVSRFTRPYFKWIERADPLKVANKDVRRTRRAAANEQNANAAIGDLFAAETEAVLTTHLQWWNEQFWSSTGAPTDETATVWDKPHGLKVMLDEASIVGGIDRALSTNVWWRGHYDSTAKSAVMSDLINDAMYTKGIANKGMGLNLMIVGANLMPIFLEEAKTKGGTIYYNGLPEMGEIGFKREIIRYNNTYITYDPRCPSKVGYTNGTNSENANHVAILNLDTWTIAVNPDANFEISKWNDQALIEGGDDATTSTLRTELIICCEAPKLNAYYSSVG